MPELSLVGLRVIRKSLSVIESGLGVVPVHLVHPALVVLSLVISENCGIHHVLVAFHIGVLRVLGEECWEVVELGDAGSDAGPRVGFVIEAELLGEGHALHAPVLIPRAHGFCLLEKPLIILLRRVGFLVTFENQIRV